MVSIPSLWLPILLSAVAVFIASSIIHMVLGYHAADYKKLPAEDDVDGRPSEVRHPARRLPGAVRRQREGDEGPGFHGEVQGRAANHDDRHGQRRRDEHGAAVHPVVPVLHRSSASRPRTSPAARSPPGAHYLAVFRFAGATAFFGYSLALWQSSIWYRKSWGTTIRLTIDGLIFGLLTGGFFGWLWPR